jgi:hypothetical protein
MLARDGLVELGPLLRVRHAVAEFLRLRGVSLGRVDRFLAHEPAVIVAGMQGMIPLRERLRIVAHRCRQLVFARTEFREPVQACRRVGAILLALDEVIEQCERCGLVGI